MQCPASSYFGCQIKVLTMSAIQYKHLNNAHKEKTKLTTVVLILLTIGGVAVFIGICYSRKINEVFHSNDTDVAVKPTPLVKWLYTINDSISSYYKEEVLIRRPVILLPDQDRAMNTTVVRKLVCYYEYKQDKLQPNFLDANMCTHLLLAFATIDTNCTIYVEELYLQVIPKVTALRHKNSKLRVLVSVGGGDDKSFPQMVANHAKRKIFIRSLMFFIKLFDLDGVDYDWEFPAVYGHAREKIQFIQLLQETRTEFSRHKRRYELTAAVAAVQTIVDPAYYVYHVAENVDFINLMGYDYHFYQRYYPVTENNAPLYGDPSELDSYLATLNVNYSVHYWHSSGMPWEKIVLGVPTYGHTYTLFNPDNNGVRAPASGIGSVGFNGGATYAEVCAFLNQTFTVQVLDRHTKVPYCYNMYDWVSYENEDSIAYKAEYIRNMNLGGAMVWSIINDDYNGDCSPNKTTFPLIRKLHSLLLTQEQQ